jgi:predicted NUDIX family NTP pyrophosphohydrolase
MRIMVKAISAGVLLYRRRPHLEVFLVHPGGPFWAKKDAGSWSIPKGLVAEGEDLQAAARREFAEETGLTPHGEFRPLSPITQRGGKTVYAWAVEGDADPAHVHSNTFSMEWPPRSGRQQAFPEIDRVAWFAADEALVRILPAQAPFIEQLRALVGSRVQPPEA